jgi:hypothetical protein
MSDQYRGGQMVKLTFRALPADSPFAVRLRHLLKTALRGCRLRCVRVEDVPAVRLADEADSPANAKPGALPDKPGMTEPSEPSEPSESVTMRTKSEHACRQPKLR